PPLGDVGEKPKSEKLSKPMAQRFLPPSSGVNTVCCAALITRSRGTLLGGLHDDSQSEVFYYAIFISSKTGLGGWSQCPRRVVLSLASGITLNGINRSLLPSSTSSGVKPAKKAFSILSEPFVCAYWKIWATSSLSDLIQIISQSGLLDSEWVREVLGLSPNVGLEALAESLNIPEGSQDKDSLKVLTELPRSQSMKVLAGKDHGMRKRKKRCKGKSWTLLCGVDSELHLNRKQQAASTTPKADCRHEMSIKSIKGSLIKAGKQEDLTELMMDWISKGERLT
nr:hypothetical protein [Tanacetum cinerariifolium]